MRFKSYHKLWCPLLNISVLAPVTLFLYLHPLLLEIPYLLDWIAAPFQSLFCRSLEFHYDFRLV